MRWRGLRRVERWGVVGEEECGIARVRWRSRAWDVELIEDGPDDGWIIDDRDDAEAPAASRALEDVGVEGAAHERSPVDARRGGDERARLQALPMAYRQDVRREQASES